MEIPYAYEISQLSCPWIAQTKGVIGDNSLLAHQYMGYQCW